MLAEQIALNWFILCIEKVLTNLREINIFFIETNYNIHINVYVYNYN